MSDHYLNMFLTKLLWEHNLAPDKWVPLFHNAGITTKANLTANKGSSLSHWSPELVQKMRREASENF